MPLKKTKVTEAKSNANMRSRSRGNKSLDISVNSNHSASNLQKEDEQKVNSEFYEITKQILSGGPEASSVTNVQKITLSNLAKQKPNIFLNSFKNFIERLLVLEADDALMRNFLRLLDKLFHDFFKSKQLKESKLTKLLIFTRWASNAKICSKIPVGDVQFVKTSRKSLMALRLYDPHADACLHILGEVNRRR